MSKEIFKQRLAGIIPQYGSRLDGTKINQYADRLAYLFGGEGVAENLPSEVIARSLIHDPVEQVKLAARRGLGLDDNLRMTERTPQATRILGIEELATEEKRRERYDRIVRTMEGGDIDQAMSAFVVRPYTGYGYGDRKALKSHVPNDKFYHQRLGTIEVDPVDTDVIHSYESVPTMEMTRWGYYGRPDNMDKKEWDEASIEDKRGASVFKWRNTDDSDNPTGKVRQILEKSPGLRAYLLFGSAGVKNPKTGKMEYTSHNYHLLNGDLVTNTNPDGKGGMIVVPRPTTPDQLNAYNPNPDLNIGVLPLEEAPYFSQEYGYRLVKYLEQKAGGLFDNPNLDKRIEAVPEQATFRETKKSRQGEYKGQLPLATLVVNTPNEYQPKVTQDLLSITNIPTQRQRAREWEKESWDRYYQEKGLGVGQDRLDALLADALEKQSARLAIEKGAGGGLTPISLTTAVQVPQQQRQYEELKNQEKQTWVDYYDAKGRGASDDELNILRKRAQSLNEKKREVDVGFSKGFREGVKQATVLPMTVPRTETNLLTATGVIPEESKGEEQIVRYAKSYVKDSFPDDWDMGLNLAGKWGYHLGAIKADITGSGTKSLLWNIFPLEQLNKVGNERTINEKINDTWKESGISKKSNPTVKIRPDKMTTAQAATTMWLTGEMALISGGNYNPFNISEGMRAAGTEALSPDEEDPRKSTSPVSDMAQRTLFFRKGRILPWEEYHQEKPNVSYGDYQRYKNWSYGKTNDPVSDVTMGLVKVTPSNADGQAEINMMGVSATPLSLAATGATYYALNKHLWKLL